MVAAPFAAAVATIIVYLNVHFENFAILGTIVSVNKFHNGTYWMNIKKKQFIRNRFYLYKHPMYCNSSSPRNVTIMDDAIIQM